jgi:SOS-response transcriptional repressor LexA
MSSENLKNPKHSSRKRVGNVEYLPTVQWKETILPNWATAEDRFSLSQVFGDSLAAAGINDGDFVLIHLTQQVSEGDLVGVSTPAGFLVKFLSYTPDGSICLRGANGDLPQIFPANQAHIQGRIIR